MVPPSPSGGERGHTGGSYPGRHGERREPGPEHARVTAAAAAAGGTRPVRPGRPAARRDQPAAGHRPGPAGTRDHGSPAARHRADRLRGHQARRRVRGRGPVRQRAVPRPPSACGRQRAALVHPQRQVRPPGPRRCHRPLRRLPRQPVPRLQEGLGRVRHRPARSAPPQLARHRDRGARRRRLCRAAPGTAGRTRHDPDRPPAAPGPRRAAQLVQHPPRPGPDHRTTPRRAVRPDGATRRRTNRRRAGCDTRHGRAGGPPRRPARRPGPGPDSRRDPGPRPRRPSGPRPVLLARRRRRRRQPVPRHRPSPAPPA